MRSSTSMYILLLITILQVLLPYTYFMMCFLYTCTYFVIIYIQSTNSVLLSLLIDSQLLYILLLIEDKNVANEIKFNFLFFFC